MSSCITHLTDSLRYLFGLEVLPISHEMAILLINQAEISNDLFPMILDVCNASIIGRKFQC
jgi:hypothetical protein